MGKRGRLGLAAWLRQLLREKKFQQQLWWVDKEEQIFAFRWTHASCACYDPEIDSVLFHEWAKHTGNAKSTTHEAKTWKATFRCALGSVSSLQKINKSPGSRGKPPLLIYKFLQKPETKKKLKPQPIKTDICNVSTEMPVASDELFSDGYQLNFDWEGVFDELNCLLFDDTTFS